MADRARRLLVKTPGGSASDIVLRSDRAVIGRSKDCDVVLDGDFVSRHHAALEVRDNGTYLVDLGSKNGVEFKGKRVKAEQRLRHGDEFKVGEIQLTYTEHAKDAETTQLFFNTGGPNVDDEPLFVDVGAWEVWVGGRPVAERLSLQEFTFIRMLFEAGGNVVTREALGDAIWGAGQWDDNMLNQLVRRVRDKIEPDPKNPQYIEAIPRVGYKLRIRRGSGNEAGSPLPEA